MALKVKPKPGDQDLPSGTPSQPARQERRRGASAGCRVRRSRRRRHLGRASRHRPGPHLVQKKLGVERWLPDRSVYFRSSPTSSPRSPGRTLRAALCAKKIDSYAASPCSLSAKSTHLPVIPGGGNLVLQLIKRPLPSGSMESHREPRGKPAPGWETSSTNSVVATALNKPPAAHHAVVAPANQGSTIMPRTFRPLAEHIGTEANIQTLPIPSTLRASRRPPIMGRSTKQRFARQLREWAPLGRMLPPAAWRHLQGNWRRAQLAVDLRVRRGECA